MDDFEAFDELAARIGETDYNDGDLNQLRNDLLALMGELARSVRYVVSRHVSVHHAGEEE